MTAVLTTKTPVANLANLLVQTARLFPDHIGLIQGEQQFSWQAIYSRVVAMASALSALGVKKGDRILVLSRNNPVMFESCWAAFYLGCVWVPVNFRLSPPEVAYLAESSGAVVMLVEPQFEAHAKAAQQSSGALQRLIWIDDRAEALIAQHIKSEAESANPLPMQSVDYDDPLWFFYTSGTTGRPKAAMLTHGQMAFVVTNHLADLIPGTTHIDRSIAVAPLSHGAGIHALLNVSRGAATVLLPSEKLNPEIVWQLIEKHKVSNLFTVPTIVKILVEDESVDRYDHSSLRYVIYAGAPMYRSDQKLALQKLGKVLVQYFGLGEVTGCITVLPRDVHSADDHDTHANIGSCGYARTGMEVVVLDSAGYKVKNGEVGEICCRGPAVFAGYFNNPEATAKALRGGWFHTGDLGCLDERGFLYITGRESDMYISGGSNVYPREVEEVLLTHPAVQEVAVLGMPDAKWGEVGVAVVVKKLGVDEINQAVLLAHLDGKSARYRWPQHFFFWPELPKSGYGKIVKKDIRTLLIEQGLFTEQR